MELDHPVDVRPRQQNISSAASDAALSPDHRQESEGSQDRTMDAASLCFFAVPALEQRSLDLGLIFYPSTSTFVPTLVTE